MSGIVKDPSGAVISEASVDVYNEQTKELERHTVTTTAGLYNVGSLHPGLYRVEVTAKGFRKYLVRMEVRINEVERQDVTLEIGPSAETIEVTAASTLVNTEARRRDNRSTTKLLPPCRWRNPTTCSCWVFPREPAPSRQTCAPLAAPWWTTA